MMPKRLLIALTLLVIGLWSATPVSAEGRVSNGLQALYDFSEGEGKTVHDRSGVGKPLDLTIDDAKGVQWSSGSLALKSSSLIASPAPAKKIIDAVQKSGAITIEAWLRPANANQNGPARVISLSADNSNRNITLGQERDTIDVRLRTTQRDQNGLPSTSTSKNSFVPRLTHVVFTRDRSGNAAIYIDGKRVIKQRVGGQFGNWDRNHRLALGNEFSRQRPWRGQFHLVAIYSRAFNASDVQANFAAGSKWQHDPTAPPPGDRDQKLASSLGPFETVIAPLFAKHCLECHDSAIKQGGLDLSRKVEALAGGESGKVISPGKSADSLLWESVAADDMPKDRPPLSAQDKAALKHWLDGGADWSIDVIDPATYRHAGKDGDVWVQRLTVPEYIATVKSAVGVDIAKEAREILPADLRGRIQQYGVQPEHRSQACRGLRATGRDHRQPNGHCQVCGSILQEPQTLDR